jgi:hypothetical protein
MADKLSIQILRRADLKTPGVYDRFDDPDQLAVPHPPKMRALLENPLAGGDDEPAQLIGLSGNRVIGRMDLIPSEITVGSNAPSRIFWGSHLIVPEPFRNTLMGVMLIMKAAGLGVAAGAFGPSQAALPVYQKLKWVDLPLTRHLLIVRSRPVVRRYVKNAVAAAALTAVADTALAVWRLAINGWRAMRARGLRIEPLQAAPAEWDAHFSARTELVRIHRSARFINWQLSNQFIDEPRSRNSLFNIRDHHGETVGYFLNKVRFHETASHRGFKDVLLGSLQDWMIFNPARLDMKTILLLSLGDLFSQGVNAVDFCTSDPTLRTTLKLIGFRQLGALNLLYKPQRGDSLADVQYHNLSKWWIRPGDGDNFFI